LAATLRRFFFAAAAFFAIFVSSFLRWPVRHYAISLATEELELSLPLIMPFLHIGSADYAEVRHYSAEPSFSFVRLIFSFRPAAFSGLSPPFAAAAAFAR